MADNDKPGELLETDEPGTGTNDDPATDDLGTPEALSGPREVATGDDELSPEQIEAYVATQKPLPRGPRPEEFPTKHYVQPCEFIMRGGDKEDWQDRYRALIKPMALAGGELMRTDDFGTLVIADRLRACAPWLEPAIAAIERQLFLQNWAGRPWLAWRPLYLVGPPGTGKSYLARKIAELAGSGYGVIDLAGNSDNRMLEGTPRGFSTAHPCWPAMMIDQTKCPNPVLVVDEIDKAGGSDRNGRPLDTLLTMIERETARQYFDTCLLGPVDLSHVCWIFAGNTADTLPGPLRSRLEIIHIEGPTSEHFDGLISAMLIDLACRWELPISAMPDLPPKALRALRDMFVRTRSVRRLQRHVEGVIAALIPHHTRSVH